MRGSRLPLILTIFLLTLLVGGCAGANFSEPESLETESGFPEIRFESVHVKKGDLAGVLINYYLDKGHLVRNRTQSTVVLDGPLQQSSFSRYRIRKTFNFVQTRNQLRVVAQAQRLELPLSGSSRVQDVVDLAPGSSDGRALQSDLEEIRSQLVDEETFQGLEGTEDTPAANDESDTSSDN